MDGLSIYDFDIANYSPTGPEWGYGGSGPAQLVLGMTADLYGDEMLKAGKPVPEYEAIQQIVSELPNGEEWKLTETSIRTQVGIILALDRE